MGNLKTVHVIRRVAADARVTIETARTVLAAFADVVIDGLAHGDSIPFRPVGRFSIKVRRARQYVPFEKGKMATSHEHRVVVFTPTRQLKSAVED